MNIENVYTSGYKYQYTEEPNAMALQHFLSWKTKETKCPRKALIRRTYGFQLKKC